MHSIAETKKNHLWRKVIWHTDPDEHPLGPYHSVEIYCCEEANGYSVWYVRKLPKDDARGVKGVDSADYLLNFYSKTGRDDAIERAVLLANCASSADEIVRELDTLASNAQKV